MNVEIKNDTDNTLVCISGRVDSVTAPQLDAVIPQICPDGSKGDIVADCRDMEYISSAGLRAFIVLLKRAKAMGRELRLENLSPSIRSIFDMTGFTKIFNIS